MSYKQGERIHIEDDDAQAGEKTGRVRWILAISLLAAIAILSAIWIFGAFSEGDVEEEVVMREQSATANDNASETDVLLSDEDNDMTELDGSSEMQDGIAVIENE